MKVKYKVAMCLLGIFLCSLFFVGNLRISAHDVIQRCFFPESGILTFQENEDMEALLDVPVGNNRELIKAYKSTEDENKYYFFLPAGVLVDKIEVVNGEDYFIKNVSDSFAADGLWTKGLQNIRLEVLNVQTQESRWIELCMLQAEELPTLFITAEKELEYLKENKEEKTDAEMTLYDVDVERASGYEIEIKGHGNSSWSEKDKKSWRLEFEQDTALLGMTKGKEFVAISNVTDYSHMRNKFVFDMAREIGFAYVPQGKYVNVYLNGEFQGLYLLTEKIEVSPERVALGRDNTQGRCSYLFREDEELYGEMDVGFLTEDGHEYEILYPENPSAEQISHLKDCLLDFHAAIQEEDGCFKKHYLAYMDLDSFVKKYLIEEITKNRDGNRRSSYYFINSELENDKIFAGPVWDYDIAFGNNTSPMWEIPEGIVGLNPGLDEREEFMTVAVQYYKELFRPYLVNQTAEKLDALRAQIESSAHMDGIRWNYEKENSLNTETKRLKDYIAKRTAFLDDVWLKGKTYCRMNYVDGDTVIHTVYLEKGSCIDTYIPNSADKVFCGWYQEDLKEAVDFSQPITEDMAVWAKWKETAE